MKFKSQIYSQTSGSVGGHTFSHNKGGLYTRARAIPTNPNTAAQQGVRNALKTLTTMWANTLTATQRTGWATYATNVPLPNTLGDSRTIPPMSMFVRCNSPRLYTQGASAVIAPPPTTYSLATFTLPVMSQVSGAASLAFTNTDAWAIAAGGFLLAFISTPQNKTINYFKGPYKYMNFVAGSATPPTSPKVAFGTLPVSPGARYFIRYRVSNADGRLSASLTQILDV